MIWLRPYPILYTAKYSRFGWVCVVVWVCACVGVLLCAGVSVWVGVCLYLRVPLCDVMAEWFVNHAYREG
jgi:hypothetical protein